MSPTPQHSPEALLRDAGWIQELARHMATGADAEDLAQEALLAGLEGPRAPVRSLRAWLAGVVRNRARQDARAAASRRAREELAARDEALPSSAELVERLSVHRAVAREVAALAEPYRSTVLLRFFEGLSQSEIAARTGTPVATVNSRLTRALALLRARLAARHDGDDGAWLAAILPLGVSSGAAAPPAATILGALAVTKTVLVLSGAAALILFAFLFARGERVPPATTLRTPAEELAAPGVAGASRAARPAAREAVDAPAPEPAAVAATTQAAVADTIPGRVFDVRGRSLPGAQVSIARPYAGLEAGLVSDASGAFELPAPTDEALHAVHATRPGFTEVVSSEVGHDTRSVEVVLAPALTVSGRVVDERGAPVAQAAVVFDSGSVWRTRFSIPLESVRTVSWRTQADADGRFLLESVPAVEGCHLFAEDDARRSVTQPLELEQAIDVVLVLREAPPGAADSVTGRVLLEDGTPAAEAWVAIGHAGRTTDADGRFALPRGLIEPGHPLWAAKPGFLPARVAAPADGAWPDELLLHLGGPALSITGRLLDPGGAPVPRREVWLANPTTFGNQGGWNSHLEAVLAGERGDTTILTDADGVFRFTGLLDRSYDLVAADNATSRFARLPDVLAGRAGVELWLRENTDLGPLAGRVVDSSGAPLAGISVEASVLLRSWTFDGLDPDPFGESVFHSKALTGPDGSFRIEDVPSHVARIELEGEGLARHPFDLGEDSDRERLVLVAPRSRHVQVEASGAAAEADEFELCDAGGKALWMRIRRSRGSSLSTRWLLHEGRSSVVSVADTARTLVLLRDGEELARREVPTLGEGVTTLRAD